MTAQPKVNDRVTLTASAYVKRPELNGSGTLTHVWPDGMATVVWDAHGGFEVPLTDLMRSIR